MNWDAIGAIGELVGAAAVVASLIYLAIQIRASNRAAKNALMQELQNTSKVVLHKDADDAAIYIAGLRDFESLSEVEQFKFRCLFEVSIIDHARLFHLRKAGEIDEWISHAWDFSLNGLTSTPGVRQWYEKCGKSQMDPEFHDHFVRLMRDNEGKSATWIEKGKY